MSSTSTTLPDWLMLDRFVFCSENFALPKDADSAQVYSTNSMGRKFRICFKLVKPPEVSRLYLQIDGGLCEYEGFDIVAAHRGALLLQMSYPIHVPDCKPVTMIDYFLYRTAGGVSLPSLQLLPDVEGTVAQIQDRMKANAYVITHQFVRRLACLDLGVLCRGEDEVAIADLEINGSGEPPKLHVMFPSISSSWEVKNPPIIPLNNAKQFDLEEFFRNFDADTVVPFKSYLFWVDYSLGILFCNVFDESPKLQYLELPDQWPEFCYRGIERILAEESRVVGVSKGGIMKFVKVFSGAQEFPQTTATASDDFTIISWELKVTESNSMMKWEQDAVLKTSEIKFDKPSDIPCAPLGYPVISMDEPSVIYFMIGDNKKAVTHNKIWIVAIDIEKRMVKSTSKYINGVEQVGGLNGEEAFYFATEKPRFSQTFLPAEFSKHLNLLGTR